MKVEKNNVKNRDKKKKKQSILEAEILSIM